MGEYRFLANDIKTEGNNMVGTAIVYGRPSQPMSMKTGTKFIEIIEQGAAREAIRGDVLALHNHDTAKVLGRTSAGTLKLIEDNDGVHFNLSLPDTSDGRDVRELVKRGDIRGMSFYLETPKGGDTWTRNQDGMLLRKVRSLTNLKEISTTAAPAYIETSAALRSLEDWQKEQELLAAIPSAVRMKQSYLIDL